MNYLIYLANYYLGEQQVTLNKNYNLAIFDYNNEYLGDIAIKESLRDACYHTNQKYYSFHSQPIDRLAYILSGQYVENFPTLIGKC